MEDEELELSEEELEKIIAHPYNEVNFDKAMENKELFRQEQIEELKKLREELKPSTDKRRR